MNPPWFRFWVENWLASSKVRAMSDLQFRVYVTMLCRSWQVGPLFDPELEPNSSRVQLQLAKRTVQKAWTFPLTECWKKTPEGLINERLEEEREHAKGRQLKGKVAAQTRWKKDTKAMLKHDPDECSSNAKAHAQASIEQCYIEEEEDKNKTLIPSKTRESSSRVSLSKPSLKKKNSKGTKETLSAGAAAWRGLGVAWEEYCSGVTWNKEKGEVELDGLAGVGLREHLEEMAKAEGLPMLSAEQLQEGWGRMNSNFLADARKRGKHLPNHVMKWLENDMRRLGSYSKGKAAGPPPAFQALREELAAAALEEDTDARG